MAGKFFPARDVYENERNYGVRIMNPLISVIIPVYNVEEYLHECLESVINQTYKNIEIILIDDGSTDSSGDICDEYKHYDSRIEVIHKKNGGLSDARNAGLAICAGEYISFVDSDDTIEYNMLEILLRNALDNNAEISMCRCNKIVDNRKINYFGTGNISTYQGRNRIIDYLFFLHGTSIAVWLKLYKKDNLNLFFPVGKTNEDVFVVLDLVHEHSRLVIQDIGLYNYRLRLGSITHQKKYKRSILDCVDAYQYNLERIEIELPECLLAAKRRLAWAQTCVMWQLLLTENYRNHYKKISYLQKKLRLNVCSLLISKISLQDKIMFGLASLSPKMYKNVRMMVEKYLR